MILCDSISLGQTCNTTHFCFSKNLETIRGSGLPDSHNLKTQLESLNEELIELHQSVKKQQNIQNRAQKTLNSIDDFLEQYFSGNGLHQLYTARNNTYIRNKNNGYLTSEYNNKYYVYVKPGVSRSQQLEE